MEDCQYIHEIEHTNHKDFYMIKLHKVRARKFTLHIVLVYTGKKVYVVN